MGWLNGDVVYLKSISSSSSLFWDYAHSKMLLYKTLTVHCTGWCLLTVLFYMSSMPPYHDTPEPCTKLYYRGSLPLCPYIVHVVVICGAIDNCVKHLLRRVYLFAFSHRQLRYGSVCHRSRVCVITWSCYTVCIVVMGVHMCPSCQQWTWLQ